MDATRWDLSEAPPLPHPGDIEQPSSAVDPGYVQSLPSDLSVKTLRCAPSSVFYDGLLVTLSALGMMFTFLDTKTKITGHFYLCCYAERGPAETTGAASNVFQ